MALWAFHNNPGIGGFGESNPILFGGAKIHTKKRSTILSPSSNYKNNVPATNFSDRRSNNWNTASSTNNEYSVGKGDLICQIVKELVDNAVDACRNPLSGGENLQTEKTLQNQKKRIRVDIRPFSDNEAFDDDVSVGSCRDEVLQLTVTDTGCGMENIQGCVNAFQSSKGGGDPMSQKSSDKTTANGISSGRYGIGLTLCLLHAQRCVPNTRASISSATPQSKHLIRAFFEVDKQQDSIMCVQEEVVNFTTAPTESGTCVSLLIPGGTAAKLAWPRLKDYFARFRLCTKLHFELDVFAPTLSKLPIFIRPRQFGKSKLGDESYVDQRDSTIQTSRDVPKNDQWEDLLEGDGSEEENDSNERKTHIDKEETSSDCSDENERHEFISAVQSFWPDCNVAVENVARSVRNIRTFNDEATSLAGEETQRKSVAQLEVNMVVCPDLDHDQKSDSNVDSDASIPNDLPSGDEKNATLQLVRIVNDVPIIENAEAHSCGLVHGIANKRIWGSFGLDIERSAIVAPDTGVSTPSFLLRDSGLVAPFINKNGNHKQLEADGFGTNHDQSYESNRKRRIMGSPPGNLCPANVRIGTIILVVHVRADPSSLPLPTLSKGRLPLNHQLIDEALQLGLRDCMTSLQSTSRGLFLTSSQLRTAERDVRYVPAIASAASRIICRSRNRLLRSKCLGFFPKESAGKGKHLQESISDVEGKDERKNLQIPTLANALESRLRLAIQARDELVSRKRSKRQKASSSCCHVTDEEFEDFDSERGGEESFRVSVSDKSDSLSSSLVGEEAKQLESAWTSSLDSESSQGLSTCQRFEEYSSEAHELPITEIVIKNCSTQSTNEEEEESFGDWL